VGTLGRLPVATGGGRNWWWIRRAAVHISVALGWTLSALLPLAGTTVSHAQVVPYTIVDDGIPNALTTTQGDATRGRALVADRYRSMCLLCHQAPIAEEKFQGDISTNLAGAGARWSAAQLRLRIVDARRANPQSLMPAYHRVEHLTRVAANVKGKPIFDAQQVEDVIAYLMTLK
jgi:L-cysteine S-thiosulfotransferase